MRVVGEGEGVHQTENFKPNAINISLEKKKNWNCGWNKGNVVWKHSGRCRNMRDGKG